MVALTPQQEADAATLAYHAALLSIGANALSDAIVLWDEVPPGSSPATASRWLRAAKLLVLTRRKVARDLALAYYRLVRALHTGNTVADPRREEPKTVPLDTLRDQFAALTRPATAPETEPAPETPEPPPEGGTEASDADTDQILVEELAALAEEEAAVEAAIEREIEIALEALGPANQAEQIDAIGDEGEAADVDKARDEAHTKAGTRQGAAVERLVRGGAHSEVWTAMNLDKRLLGYIRYSTSGTPCGWCAMLISRGPVYRSKQSATYSDGDKYHDNCHCEALPVFTTDEYDSSSLYALNRKYAEQWPVVTKGLSGKSALTAWRRFIRQEQKSMRAQEARTTTNVQEA